MARGWSLSSSLPSSHSEHLRLILADRGALLVAAADTGGTVADEHGLDGAALIRLREEGRTVCDHPSGRRLGRDAVIDIDCDIWIPAARPDVVNEGSVGGCARSWCCKGRKFR